LSQDPLFQQDIGVEQIPAELGIGDPPVKEDGLEIGLLGGGGFVDAYQGPFYEWVKGIWRLSSGNTGLFVLL
jgi:hypothetical protein